MENQPRRSKPPKLPSDEDSFGRILRITLVVFIVVAVLAVIYAPPQLAVLAVAIPIVLPIVLFVGARLAKTVYNPSGARVPSRPGYSGAESLAVRGRFEDAINAYELAAQEEPTDPEPWLRIARIERSDLKRPQRAIEALRAARTRVPDDSPTAIMISKEIAETFMRDLNDPPRAMPELARLAAAFPDTPTGKWAATELAELKKSIADRIP